MDDFTRTRYPRYEDHQRAWLELAKDIAGLKSKVGALDDAPPALRGELTILGSGIETVGFSLGDQKLLEAADKVLYCVADPATTVWLKRLRPDALDLYVLYGEDKIRYTTYMQMAEAQLYWVRQGLKVVVVFYGHPGVFVLSTHRAIKLARREGHRAVMKAAVSALDTLCADLGVDPSHPGLQTHEATDSLIRRRRIDTTLHVILWQVGLIGEMGYRRHGYLNSNFSYFVNWLEEIYGPDCIVTHYIGSRYPAIDPLIERFGLEELHSPAVQARITGLSTFYIPPRDVVPTDRQTAIDLGLLRENQRLTPPSTPLREIDQYGLREMAAFTAFEKFRIPAAYRWQDETPASNFLIELRFDTALQELYRRDSRAALDDPRFANLSDRERALLASRDSGAVQVAAKGAYKRSPENEAFLARLLNSKSECAALVRRVAGKPRPVAQAAVLDWIATHAFGIDWSQFHASVDHVYRSNLYPWSGVYLASAQKIMVVLLGNQTRRSASALFVNGMRIEKYQFEAGVLKWASSPAVPFSGVLKFDDQQSGLRRLIGRTWAADRTPAEGEGFVAAEVNPGRAALAPRLAEFRRSLDLSAISGDYALRASGRFSREVMRLSISLETMSIDGQPVSAFRLEQGGLVWTGGQKSCFSGRLEFLHEPIAGGVDLYGQTQSNDEPGTFKCYGTRLVDHAAQGGAADYHGPPLPDWAAAQLMRIVSDSAASGGLMLWHKWEKYNFTSLAVCKYVAGMV